VIEKMAGAQQGSIKRKIGNDHPDGPINLTEGGHSHAENEPEQSR
jgi:hypothetical protein